MTILTPRTSIVSPIPMAPPSGVRAEHTWETGRSALPSSRCGAVNGLANESTLDLAVASKALQSRRRAACQPSILDIDHERELLEQPAWPRFVCVNLASRASRSYV